MARRMFWGAVGIMGWTHAVFPLLLLLRARLRPRPVRTDGAEPTVSVIIAAHNEEAVIEDRVTDIVEQGYPPAKLEIIVASDGSSDATVARATAAHQGVHVLDLPRVGKTAALNAAVEAAGGDVLVFTDANTAFASGALRAIVAPFADPEVGGAAGDQRYLPGGEAGDGERAHWSLDRLLKRAESLAGSCISATGALYAVRREDFEPCPPGVTDDFVISTGPIERGRRLVFCESAIAYEPVAAGGTDEYARKVRIITQGLNAVAHRRRLLDPRRYGFYSLQLLTHKILRRLTVVPLLTTGLTAPLLLRRGSLYRFVLLGHVVAALAGIAGLFGPARVRRNRLASMAAYLLLVNVAALHSLANLLFRRRITQWSPQGRVSR